MNDPGNLNIIVSATERCGVSWFCSIISLFYKQMYGGEIDKWNFIASRLMAGHINYPILKGWNTVQWVPIEKIIRKPYDKIILLQRSLESLKESLFIYYFAEKEYEEEKDKEKYKHWFKKIERYYEKVYAENDHPNVLRVHLEDLNNYTVATFNEILDFLGFLKEGRPIIIPINPHDRVWQTFSSILDKGQIVNQRLQNIHKKYNNKELQFRKQDIYSTSITGSTIKTTINNFTKKERQIQNGKKFTLNPNRKQCVDVFDILEENIQIIKKEEKRKKMQILIIGKIGAGMGCHFSEHINRELRERNDTESIFLTIKQITNDFGINRLNYSVHKKNYNSMELSKILARYDLSPDFIFIDGSSFSIINDTKYFVFYHHRGLTFPFVVYNANVIFLTNRHYISRKGVSSLIQDLYPSVDLQTFHPKEKTIKEIAGIGYRRSVGSWKNVTKASTVYESIIDLMEAEINVFKKSGYKFFDTPISDERFRELLPKMSVYWYPVSYNWFMTRRMLEAMACKTLCVFRLDNEQHEQHLKELGFENGIHYVGLKSIEEIPQIKNIIKKLDTDKIIEKAYKVVTTRHTHAIRVKEIVNLYKTIYKEEYMDVIVPLYNIEKDLWIHVDNWFKELPIRKLILGIGKDEITIPEKYKNKIITINQKENKTLGKCLADLMKKVETEWFVFLHSDAEVCEYSFEIMKQYMTNRVGAIEADAIVIKRTKDKKDERNYYGRQYIKRAYSGFQIFKTEALQNIITKIEDDYIYRNEDIIFQNAVWKSGFKYIKTSAPYLHFNQSNYKKNEKDAKDMFLGILKYTFPNRITTGLLIGIMKSYMINYKPILTKDILKFIEENNINYWKTVLNTRNPFIDNLKDYYRKEK